MSDQVQTEEFARNPNPEIRIVCTDCKKEYPLEGVLHERAMPAPYQTVTEGYLKCPNCGTEKHSYYMSELLRFKQKKLKLALETWNNTKKSRAWREYALLQKQFQTSFDAAQKKYTEMFQKETSA